MRQIQASEAEARFLELLDDVERGDTVIITRHGRPVARITAEGRERREEIDAVIAAIQAHGRSKGLVQVEEILSARDEGRL